MELEGCVVVREVLVLNEEVEVVLLREEDLLLDDFRSALRIVGFFTTT